MQKLQLFRLLLERGVINNLPNPQGFENLEGLKGYKNETDEKNLLLIQSRTVAA
mgnify:CR=1 FL=1